MNKQVTRCAIVYALLFVITACGGHTQSGGTLPRGMSDHDRLSREIASTRSAEWASQASHVVPGTKTYQEGSYVVRDGRKVRVFLASAHIYRTSRDLKVSLDNGLSYDFAATATVEFQPNTTRIYLFPGKKPPPDVASGQAVPVN